MHVFANVKLSFSEVGVATNRFTLVQTSALAPFPDERFHLLCHPQKHALKIMHLLIFSFCLQTSKQFYDVYTGDEVINDCSFLHVNQ